MKLKLKLEKPSRRLTAARLTLGTIASVSVASVAFGAIPEPSALIHGALTTTSGYPLPEGTTITATSTWTTNQDLNTYTVDFAQGAGFEYVLNIPMVNIAADGSSQPDDKAIVDNFVDVTINWPEGSHGPVPVQLTDRGKVITLDVGGLFLTDTDQDGIPDIYETSTGIYLSVVDTGSDPIASDSDADGVDDGAEVTAGTDPNNPPVIPGDVNSDDQVDVADAILLMRYLEGDSVVIDSEAAQLAPLGAPDQSIDVGDLVVLLDLITSL